MAAVVESPWLENLSWSAYEEIVAGWNGHALRHTFDRGKLEVLSREFREQRIKVIMRLVIHCLSMDLRIPIRGGGSPILASQARQCALNPDETFHVASVRQVRGRDCPNFDEYPPDLNVEVDVPGSRLDRMKIYPHFRVPEIWRHNGSHVEFLALEDKYRPIDRSLAFPLVKPDNVMQFVDRRHSTDDRR